MCVGEERGIQGFGGYYLEDTGVGGKIILLVMKNLMFC
jgi:hypothetical protein